MFCFISTAFLMFFFKQKSSYDMRISDWSSDVCSSDLSCLCHFHGHACTPSSSMLLHGQEAISAVPLSRILQPAPFQVILIYTAPIQPKTRTQLGRASSRESVCQKE